MSERRVKQGRGADPEVTLVKHIKAVFLLEDDRASRTSGGFPRRGGITATSPVQRALALAHVVTYKLRNNVQVHERRRGSVPV